MRTFRASKIRPTTTALLRKTDKKKIEENDEIKRDRDSGPFPAQGIKHDGWPESLLARFNIHRQGPLH